MQAPLNQNQDYNIILKNSQKSSDKKENLQNSINDIISKPSETPTQQVKLNIFNQPSKSLNIFCKNDTNISTSNIFGQGKQSVNLFNLTKAPDSNPTIFNATSKPLIKRDDDQQSRPSQISSAAFQKNQSQFKTVPDKIQMKYNYDNPWQTLNSFSLKKFRNGLKPAKQNIKINIQKYKLTDTIYLTIRSHETKLVLFQGVCVNPISCEISSFMNKEENLKMNILREIQKQKDGQKIGFARQQIKLQFLNEEDAKKFKEQVQKLIGKIKKVQNKSE